jgi:hypothetical protein
VKRHWRYAGEIAKTRRTVFSSAFAVIVVFGTIDSMEAPLTIPERLRRNFLEGWWGFAPTQDCPFAHSCLPFLEHDVIYALGAPFSVKLIFSCFVAHIPIKQSILFHRLH